MFKIEQKSSKNRANIEQFEQKKKKKIQISQKKKRAKIIKNKCSFRQFWVF
jgi:hypothetical protein